MLWAGYGYRSLPRRSMTPRRPTPSSNFTRPTTIAIVVTTILVPLGLLAFAAKLLHVVPASPAAPRVTVADHPHTAPPTSAGPKAAPAIYGRILDADGNRV